MRAIHSPERVGSILKKEVRATAEEASERQGGRLQEAGGVRILKGVDGAVGAAEEGMIVMEAERAEGEGEGVEEGAGQAGVGYRESPNGIRCVVAVDRLVRKSPENGFQRRMYFH